MVVEVKDLVKSYHQIRAVAGVSFTIPEGEIFGMVGPNGAGKTTIIECLEGLRYPDSGMIRVCGLDPKVDRTKLLEIIGVQLQETAYPDRIKVAEICKLMAALYRTSVSYGVLLERFGLADKTKAYVSQLSGGQRQRLSIILALVSNPKIVFFDELTTGLDPQSRRAIWDLIRELQKEGRTIFLTTHYMEEAEALCDRVAVVDGGRIIALDSVSNLIDKSGLNESITFSALGVDLSRLRRISGVTQVIQEQNEVTIQGADPDLLYRTITFLHQENIRFSNLKTQRPGLEEVFLQLTGRNIRSE